jgi:CheY-like chemotaxis protein
MVPLDEMAPSLLNKKGNRVPDVDGLALCQHLHTNLATASVSLIVLTGDDRAYVRIQRAHSELTSVLMKPCCGDRLPWAFRTAIE